MKNISKKILVSFLVFIFASSILPLNAFSDDLGTSPPISIDNASRTDGPLYNQITYTNGWYIVVFVNGTGVYVKTSSNGVTFTSSYKIATNSPASNVGELNINSYGNGHFIITLEHFSVPNYYMALHSCNINTAGTITCSVHVTLDSGTFSLSPSKVCYTSLGWILPFRDAQLSNALGWMNSTDLVTWTTNYVSGTGEIGKFATACTLDGMMILFNDYDVPGSDNFYYTRFFNYNSSFGTGKIDTGFDIQSGQFSIVTDELTYETYIHLAYLNTTHNGIEYRYYAYGSFSDVETVDTVSDSTVIPAIGMLGLRDKYIAYGGVYANQINIKFSSDEWNQRHNFTTVTSFEEGTISAMQFVYLSEYIEDVGLAFLANTNDLYVAFKIAPISPMFADLTLNISPSYITIAETNMSFSGFLKRGGVCTSDLQNQLIFVEDNYTGSWQTIMSLVTGTSCSYTHYTLSSLLNLRDTNGTYYFRARNSDKTVYSTTVKVVVAITEYAPTQVTVTINVSPQIVTEKDSEVKITGRVLIGGRILVESYNRHVCLESNATRYTGTTDNIWVQIPNGCKFTSGSTAMYTFTIYTGYLYNINGTYWYRVKDRQYLTGVYSENASFTIGAPVIPPSENTTGSFNSIASFIRGLGITLGIGAIGGGFLMILIIVGFFIAFMGKFHFPSDAMILLSALVGFAATAIMTLFIHEMLWILITFIFVVAIVFSVKLRGSLGGED